jgi:peptidoglycan hydrolase CwlO-like protein
VKKLDLKEMDQIDDDMNQINDGMDEKKVKLNKLLKEMYDLQDDIKSFSKFIHYRRF